MFFHKKYLILKLSLNMYMYPTDFTGRFLNKLWYFRLNCLHRNILNCEIKVRGVCRNSDETWIELFLLSNNFRIPNYSYNWFLIFFFLSETEAKTSTPRINLSPIYIFSLRIHISCAFSDDECSEEEDNGGEDVDFDDGGV